MRPMKISQRQLKKIRVRVRTALTVYQILKAMKSAKKSTMAGLAMAVGMTVAANAQPLPFLVMVPPPITNGPVVGPYSDGCVIQPMVNANGRPYGLVTLAGGWQFRAQAIFYGTNWPANSNGVAGWFYSLPQPPQTSYTVTGSGTKVSCETNPITKFFKAVAYPATTNRFKVLFTSDLMADWSGTAGYFTGSNKMLAIKSEPIIY